ncbi:MAG: dockerin type I repeat-containing protein, partial [Clostridia bacterium]|nr:dockerin type I repeat-containing protein [Clostridia bacterium]
GAVAGSMYRTTVSGVISYVNVTNTCTTSGSVGGLAGCFGGQHDPARNQYSKIENSAVYANVTGYNAGGLVGEGWGGYQYWDITNAAYFGNVTTNNTTSGTAGAIVGYQNTDYNTSTFTNIYWCETNSLGFYGKRDTKKQVYTNTSAKTAAQFASGEVAYLLNGGVTDGTQVWYQTCGQGYPLFSGKTVYYVGSCTAGTSLYSNDNESGAHLYNEEGVCTLCGLARGDVDADGNVNISDVTALLNYLADTTFVLKGDGDVDQEGTITISDVTELLNILAGN